MEEVGRKAGEELVKNALARIKGKVKSALELGEAELEVSDRGIRARAPSVKKAKELLDYGVETLLKLPQTGELLSKAGKKELEDPQVRSKKIKRSEGAQRLVQTSKVKALPEKEKLQFSVFAFIAYGDQSFHSRAFPEAEKAYRQAYEFAQKLDDKPLQGICLNLIGAALGMQAEYKKALPYLDKAIKLEPDFAEVWYNKGVMLGELGQYKEALVCYDEAIRLKPDFAEAWYNKVGPLWALNRGEEAIPCFDEALKLKPDDLDAWHFKGVVLDLLGRVEEAKTNFEQAFSLRDKLPDGGVMALTHLTMVISRRGLESIASRDMKEAEERALELLELRKEAEKDGMVGVIDEAIAEFKAQLSKKELKLFGEFELMLTILPIEDPLERWKILAKEIGEKWPKGISAVEAIREERK